MAKNSTTTSAFAISEPGFPGGSTSTKTLLPTIHIGSPSANALVGRSITVTGTAGCLISDGAEPLDTDESITEVKIKFGSGSYQLATPTGPSGKRWTSWTFTGTRSTSGTLTITALVKAAHNQASNSPASKTTSVTVEADAVLPTLTISPPADVPLPPYTTTITGTASDTKGVNRVEWRLGSGSYQSAIRDQTDWSQWHANVTFPDPGTDMVTHTVTVQAIDTAGNMTTKSVTVTVGDSIAPTLAITTPENHSTVTWIDGGVTVEIGGTASDAQSGVEVVKWGLNDQLPDQYTEAIPKAPNDWSTWSASVPLPSVGDHTIVVQAIDKAGIPNARHLELEVALTFKPVDPLDVVSPATYLQDLLNFATDHVITPSDLDRPLLTDTFYQPFDALIDSTVQKVANQPVHQVRLCVEVLRKYLTNHNRTLPIEAELGYRQAAYFTLLRHLGTSYEELRSARVADNKTRTALAARLGITLTPSRPDQLDTLVPQPDQITEENLKELFGLADTTDPFPPDTITEIKLPKWQRDHLRMLWRQQDDVPRSEVDTPVPVIDPDLTGESDLRDPIPTNPAYDLWQARQQWIEARLAEIKAMREAQATALAGFDAIVSDILGPVQEFLDLAEEHRQGNDITPQLRAKQLSVQPFLYLMRIRDLATTETVLDSEWAEVYSILVQVRKFREYETWRTEERQKNLTLGPDEFTLPSADPTIPPPLVTLPPWRATPQARRAWQETLESRISQDQAVIQALQETLAATEEATLPMLRDALVASIDPNLDLTDLANRLTHELAIDVKSSGNQQTTRVNQAIETLQGILFSLRTGRFATMEPVLGTHPATEWKLDFSDDDDDSNDYTEAKFDEEWKWMGAYTTWRAAMFVFGYPENYLLPSLREKRPSDQDSSQDPTKYPTDAFWGLVDRLRNHPRLTPAQARKEAQVYLDELIYLDDDHTQRTPVGALMPSALTNPEFQITDQFSEKQLADRREFVLTFFQEENGEDIYTDLHKVPNYLQEIFYFVPMLMALQLQKAGQYLAALDWFQTVYAYNLRIEQRKIYYGLKMEEGIETKFQRTINWLLEGLNPHDIVIGWANPQDGTIIGRANAYTRYTLMSLVRCFLEFADSEFTLDTTESIPRARALYVTALELLDLPAMQPESSENDTNPFPPNPVVQALRLHAELNLFKLRSGRNIAGMERQSALEIPQSETISGLLPVVGDGGQLRVPKPITFRPTPYRYAVLIERAKQLVTIAQQIEAAFLAALEKFDAEAYNLLKAKQDIQLTRDGVELQKLRVTEAEGGVKLAELQRDRAQLQADHFQGLLDEGLIATEDRALQAMGAGSAFLEDLVSDIDEFTRGFASAIPYVGSAFGGARSRKIQRLQTLASYERRQQEWQFQRDLAQHDMLTGDKQIEIAQDHENVVKQERFIAERQADHAEETLDFLATKFTNAELYAWMSDVLVRVYSYFLQQATAMAQLAQHQLAFERQETLPSFIQADYWQVAPEAETVTGADGETPDRRGLTGSARLLRDIFKLDQYAFETNKRKLQLSQTFSLAQLAPAEFQRFRETGVLRFAFPMELFDRTFPGHYLRLIKRVRTSVIALIPPTQGIRATLMASGISRVVIGRDTFQTIVVRRDPELVALTSPIDATGLFELQPEGELLLPFESMGVETSWELQMPRAANPFDFRTIADVLITIDYTALNSFTYRQEVIRQLDQRISADRPFSFRHQFADQWYDLHNPDQTATPMVVRFETRREDFPPNIESLKIQQVVLYVARANGATFEIPVTHLHFAEQGDDEVVGGGATTVDGVISTRRSNGASWLAMTGDKTPVGTWELAFPEEVKNRFQDEAIEDLLFVITYQGQTPAWPA